MSVLRTLSIAPLSWRHGHEHALHAVRLVVDAGIDCRHRIVGDGNHAAAVAFARIDLGLADRVEIVGDADLAAQLAWADAYVDAAVVPAQGGAEHEAARAGLRVVSTGRGEPVPGAAIVPPRDARALAAALGALV